MKIYMTIDEKGLPSGFYPTNVHDIPPKGAIEITKKEWEFALNRPGRVRWDGKNSKMVEFDPDEICSIEELKNKLLLQAKTKRKNIIKEGIKIINKDGDKNFLLKIDDQTKTNIEGYIDLYESGIKDKGLAVKWKFKNCWQNLTYNNFIEIKKIIFAFIEAAFKAEASHTVEIKKIKTYSEYIKYNIHTGWPDNSYKVKTL